MAVELEKKCFEYFRTINPIAERIGQDVENVRMSHRDKWNSVSVEERNRLVDSDQIDQELVLKYNDDLTQSCDEFDYISTFSWFSKSQLDLFTLIDVKSNIKPTVKRSEAFSPLKKHKDATEAKDNIITRIKNKVMKSPSNEDKVEQPVRQSAIVKPKMHPPPPPPGKRQELPTSSSQDDIPKTGFDFLDNW